MNLPLILLGSVVTLLTIVTTIVFIIAGGFRRKPANIKVLVASGVMGLLLIALGVLPWQVLRVAGIVVLSFGGLAVFLFIRLRRYGREKLREEVLMVREYMRTDHVKTVLRFFIRIGAVIGVILLFDMIGLSVFLFFRGIWTIQSFIELLALLLLLEGVLIGALGAFMFYGYSEYRLMGQAALWPSLAGDQAKGWSKRRLSQQKWGGAMLVAGVLLVALGLLVSFLTSL